ncbi:hypothetical protein L917_21545, partial [Phytophthora nicotianae]
MRTAWPVLPVVEFAINNVEHASTGQTPFCIHFGRHPRVPALLGVEPSSPASGVASISARPAGAATDQIALLNGVTTRRGATSLAAQRVAERTLRTLISPAQLRRAVEYRDVPDAAVLAAPDLANFAPLPAPQPRDTAA